MAESYGLVVKLAMENSSFSEKLKKTKADLKSVDAQFKASNSGMKQNESISQSLGNKYQNLSQKVNISERAMGLYRTRISELNASLGQASSKQGEHSQKIVDSKGKVDALKTTLAGLKKEYTSTTKEQGENSKASKDLNKAIEATNKELKVAKDELKQNEQAYDGNEKKMRNMANSMQNYETKLNETTASVNNMRKEMDLLARTNADRFLDATIEKTAKMGDTFTRAGDKMSAVGSTMTSRVTAPIVGAVGMATKSFIDFDSELQTMGVLMNDGGDATAETAGQLEQMGKASQTWAQQYGVSTSEINQGMEELIKKGYDFNQTMGSMPAILDATMASGDDFNTVMSVSTSVVETFGMKTKDTQSTMENTTRVTDVMTYAANATAAGFADLGEAMKNVGPAAVASNQDIVDMASALGVLSNQGIEGGQAGTYLMNALRNLQTPTKGQKEAIDALGLSIFDASGNMRKFPDILEDIESKTSGMTMETKNNTLANLFNTQALKGINPLLNAGSKQLRELTKETENSTGATKKQANQLQNTSANQIKKFKASLEVLGQTIGKEVLPAIMPLVKKLTETVQWFGTLSEAQKQNALKWIAITASIGPVLKILGLTTKTLGGTFKAISNIGLAIKAVKGLNGVAGIGMATKALTGLASEGDKAVIMATKGAKQGGLLAKMFPKMAVGTAQMAGSMGALGTAGTGAGTAVTGASTAMATGFGAVALPVVAAGVAIAGVGAVAYAVHKKNEKDRKQERATLKKNGDEYAIFAEKGVRNTQKVQGANGQMVTTMDDNYKKISKGTKKVITDFTTMSLDSVKQMRLFSLQTDSVTAEQAQKLNTNYDKMYKTATENINKHYDDKIKKIREANINELGLSEEDRQQMITNLEAKKGDATRIQNEQTEAIKKIITDASTQNRTLTNDEKIEIERLTGEMNTNVVNNTNATAEQKKSVLERIKNESGKITEETAKKVMKEANREYKGATHDAELAYNEKMALARQTREGGGKEAEELATKIEKEAEKQRKSAIKKAQEQQEGVVKKLNEGKPDIQASVNGQGEIVKSGWQNTIKSVSRWWDNLWGKISRGNASARSNANGKGGGFSGRSSNSFIGPMPAFAKGTDYFEGGVARINEEGGEIVNLPTGTSVIPHDASIKALENVYAKMGGGGAGGSQITQYITIGGDVSNERIDEMTDRISKNLHAYETRKSMSTGGKLAF